MVRMEFSFNSFGFLEQPFCARRVARLVYRARKIGSGEHTPSAIVASVCVLHRQSDRCNRVVHIAQRELQLTKIAVEG